MSAIALPKRPTSDCREALSILLVCEDIPQPALGGLAKHVVALGNALIESGHSVTLMGSDQPTYESCAAEVGFLGPFITGCGDVSRGWKETKLGIFNPWKRPVFARRIAKAIIARSHDFDVVHYHGHLAMLGRYLPANLNFLQTRHDQGSECITHIRFKQGQVCDALMPEACAGCAHAAPGPLRTAISAVAVRRYRKETARAFTKHPVIFVSDFLRRNYVRAMPHVPMHLSAVVHNFLDERLLEPPVAERSAAIIHVAGRLDESKGIAALLDLLVPRLSSPWTVHVFGSGPLSAPIASGFGANPAVVLHGHQLHTVVLTAMRRARAVVMPSMWEEPFGTVLLEALRSGQPCFALRRGAPPELAHYGAPGQLRLFDTLPELVDGLLVEAPTLRPSFGGESADVRARLPELLELYRRKLVPAQA